MKGQPAYCTLLGIFLLLAAVTGLESGETCTTPDINNGTCIEVRDCPSFVEVLKIKPIPQATLDFLRRSQCGFRNRDPLVCCPSSSPETTSPTDTEVTEDITGHRNLNLLPLDLCGPISDNRLLVGNRTKLNELPWMALVAYTVESGTPFRCGGTVINSRYVLTAAHCVKFLPSNLRPVSVRLGEHNLDSEIDCDEDRELDPDDLDCAPKPQDISIEEIIPHPSYTGIPNLQHDIALLRLSRAADFTPDTVRPICLPVYLEQQTLNLDGKKVIVSGWGVTRNGITSPQVQKISLPVMPQHQCANAFKALSISGVKQMCTGGEKGGWDFCFGDSGGPLSYFGEVQATLRTMQHGILSFGPMNCDSTYPGVYTRVGHFMSWILDNMKP